MSHVNTRKDLAYERLTTAMRMLQRARVSLEGVRDLCGDALEYSGGGTLDSIARGRLDDAKAKLSDMRADLGVLVEQLDAARTSPRRPVGAVTITQPKPAAPAATANDAADAFRRATAHLPHQPVSALSAVNASTCSSCGRPRIFVTLPCPACGHAEAR